MNDKMLSSCYFKNTTKVVLHNVLEKLSKGKKASSSRKLR